MPWAAANRRFPSMMMARWSGTGSERTSWRRFSVVQHILDSVGKGGRSAATLRAVGLATEKGAQQRGVGGRLRAEGPGPWSSPGGERPWCGSPRTRGFGPPAPSNPSRRLDRPTSSRPLDYQGNPEALTVPCYECYSRPCFPVGAVRPDIRKVLSGPQPAPAGAGARVRPSGSDGPRPPALRVEDSVYVAHALIFPSTTATTMTAVTSWALTVLGILCLVLFLHSLGVDVTASLGSMLRGTEHFSRGSDPLRGDERPAKPPTQTARSRRSAASVAAGFATPGSGKSNGNVTSSTSVMCRRCTWT